MTTTETAQTMCVLGGVLALVLSLGNAVAAGWLWRLSEKGNAVWFLILSGAGIVGGVCGIGIGAWGWT